jgi:hypothetical protein
MLNFENSTELTYYKRVVIESFSVSADNTLNISNATDNARTIDGIL